eukprot:8322088-Prorocentrum_lima.AAC.1
MGVQWKNGKAELVWLIQVHNVARRRRAFVNFEWTDSNKREWLGARTWVWAHWRGGGGGCRVTTWVGWTWRTGCGCAVVGG